MRGRHVIWTLYHKDKKGWASNLYFENRDDAREWQGRFNKTAKKRVYKIERTPMNPIKRIWYRITRRRIIR